MLHLSDKRHKTTYTSSALPSYTYNNNCLHGFWWRVLIFHQPFVSSNLTSCNLNIEISRYRMYTDTPLNRAGRALECLYVISQADVITIIITMAEVNNFVERTCPWQLSWPYMVLRFFETNLSARNCMWPCTQGIDWSGKAMVISHGREVIATKVYVMFHIYNFNFNALKRPFLKVQSCGVCRLSPILKVQIYRIWHLPRV